MAKWTPINDTRRINREHFPTPAQRNIWYAERLRLLRAMADFDSKTKALRTPNTYDEPTLGIREQPRTCSVCKQGLTYYTTGRGRSVHPTCGGWRDALSPEAEIDLLYALYAALPVKSVEAIDE